MVNFFICSTRARVSFTSVTSFRINLLISGLLVRSLYVEKLDLVILGELHHVILINHDERRYKLALISDHHGVIDVRAELQFVFNILGRDVFFPPAVTIISFFRSVILRYPSASISPTSPE